MRVLLVDNDMDARRRVRGELWRSSSPIDVDDIPDQQSLEWALDGERPDAVVTEHDLGWTGSLDVLGMVRSRWPDIPVILYTSHEAGDLAEAALGAGFDHVIGKGANAPSHLRAAIRSSVVRARQRQDAASVEVRYREFFESMPLALYLSFTDGVLVGANPAMAQLLGYPDCDSLLGTNMGELYVEQGARQTWVDRVVSEGLVRGYEVQLLRFDGTPIWVRETTRAVWGDDGTLLLQGCLEDVSGRRAAEGALRDNEAKYRTLFEAATESIFLMEGDRFVDCNSRTLEMFACNPDEILRHHPYEFSPPTQPDGRDSTDKAREKIEAALAGEPQLFDWRHRRADGTLFDAEVNLSRVDLVGRPHLHAIVRDVTDRKRTEERFRRREAILEAVAYAAARLLQVESWQDAVPDVLERLGNATGVSRGYLVQHDVQHDDEADVFGSFEWVAPGSELTAVPSAYGEAIERLEVLQEGDVVSGPVDRLPAELGECVGEGVLSLSLVPVDVGGRRWGVIVLEDCVHRREWSAGERDALRAAADILGSAVHLGRARGELESRTDELELLNRVNALLASTLDAQSVMQQIADMIRERCGVDHVSLAIVQSEERRLTFVAWSGYDWGPWQSGLDLDGHGVVAMVAREARARYLPCVDAAPDYLCGDPRARAEYAVPLIGGGEVLGVLNCESFDEDGISGRDRATIDRLAAQAAIALRNANTYRRIEAFEAQYRDFVEHSEDLIFVHDLEGRLVDVNPAGKSVLGFEPDDTAGRSIADFLEPSARAKLPDYLAELRSEQRAAGLMKAMTRSGETRILEYRTQVHHGALEDPVARGLARDITDRYHAEKAVERNALRLDALVEHLPEGVVLLDRSRRVVLCNPAAREALDVVGHLSGGGTLERIGEMAVGDVFDVADGMTPCEVESEGPTPRTFEVVVRPVGTGEGAEWVLVLREVTAERDAERQLQIQERLAAVGQLAAGIAHDFNNILQAIMLNAELAQRTLPGQPKALRRVDAILHQARQGANLIRQVLDFARKTVTKPQPMDLAPFVKESTQLLKTAIPESVRVELVISAKECRVVADPVQMQQLVTNLGMNAADAMPSGGRLRLELAPVEVRDGETPPVAEMPPGRWIQLRVVDTGCGMCDRVRERLFEPFFTTKEPGQGTGLGLAQVYGIVKQHGGHIEVDSEEGGGSTFTVCLPAAPTNEDDHESDQPLPEVLPGRGELIMVVEDDPTILDVARECLRDLGYRVITASDGGEALGLHDQVGDDIVLVLSDLVMPGIGGLELARRLRARDARAKILLMTGYPLEEDSGEHLALGIVDWLQKPFTMERLAAAVTKVVPR